ncbi:porin family protein [Perlabentimonas gracilis]|uniref:porin family protein n=1 Tax=Perlabentimonas gracilis TaxID=2715279 RepID=UPI00140A2854|nr:porin family protein [Perlabentimonas gracilis]NHB68826.1 PorT family protein [Perlabentimonas gracilis]
MKKTLLLIIVSTLLFVNAGIAQDKGSSLHFGPKVGLNLSNVYDSEGENFDADAKVGFAAGIFVAIPLGRLLGIQPELLYSQKGFKASGSILGNDYTFTRTLNYLDIPLLVVVKPSEMFSIVAGPQYSYLMSTKDVFENSFLNIEQEEEFDNDNLRKNTLCFLGGFDVNLSSIVIGARVGWDLFQNNGDGSSTTPRYKNVWYQATVGFRF